MNRTLIGVLFVFFSSCSSSSGCWISKTIHATCPSPCAILYSPPQNVFREFEVKFQRSDQGIQCFLNCTGPRLVPVEQASIPVLISIDGHEMTYNAELLEGEQSLLLPSPATEALLQALHQHSRICLCVGRYSRELDAEGFASEYESFALRS